jgi:hypothetical protein
MQGSPLIGAAIILALLGLMVVPLREFTASRVPSATQAAAAPNATPIHLELESSHAPFSFEISHLGKVVWKGDAMEKTAQSDVPMEFPKEGIDLRVAVSWPGDSSREAVKLSVTPANDSTLEKTLWGEAGVDDVLTFP